jgi:hypothetical protein
MSLSDEQAVDEALGRLQDAVRKRIDSKLVSRRTAEAQAIETTPRWGFRELWKRFGLWDR